MIEIYYGYRDIPGVIEGYLIHRLSRIENNTLSVCYGQFANAI
jgi:hypothetical protein